MVPLTAAAVAALLSCPCRVAVKDSSESTNTEVKALAEAGEGAGFVLIADRQTQGRGRMGRSFHSPGGTGLYLSLLLRPEGPARDHVFLTVRAAVAACRAVEETFGVSPGIKWVNDLILQGRKVCGILVESSMNFETDTLDYAVLGIGFNITPPAEGFPAELEGIAGALCPEDDGTKRVALAAAFLNAFYGVLAEDRRNVLSEYRRRSILIGKTVTSPTGAFEGTATVLNIDDFAGLILRLADGTGKVLTAGEVSVRLYE